jgi:RimJ/RimL family protein N-acetyltransferase
VRSFNNEVRRDETYTMVEQSNQLEWVTVKTTLPVLPYPASATRPPIRTERLLLRSLQESDARALNELRSQPEVMTWTGQGKPDAGFEATKTHLATMLPPNEDKMFQFAICLAETGELIGIGGSHKVNGELGWPVLGYMFRKEAWGKGFATEFVRAALDAWWALPRRAAEVKVEKSTAGGAGEGEADGGIAQEHFIAVTIETNHRSQNVLAKSGLELVKVWEEEDMHDASATVKLLAFAAKKPVK